MPHMGEIKITYRFHFSGGRVVEHDVRLEAETGRQISDASPSPDAWTALEYKQCSHCPLKKEEHPECPVARNLAVVANAFKTQISFERVFVEVITADRTYSKQLPLQEGLFGLVGLIMATSECPYLDFLRPMARFHLPFSTLQETTVRCVSFYLLRQYFVAKKGGIPDHDLVELQKRYDAIETVNLGMVDRIRSISEQDAETNSIATLHSLAFLLSEQLTNKLSDLDKMFLT